MSQAPASKGAGQRQLLLHDRRGAHPVSYELKRARRRSIGFVVALDGLKVSAPRWVTIADIEQALSDKGDWILRKLVEQRERRARLESARIEWREGGVLPYLGRPLTLVFAAQARSVELVEDETGRRLLLNLPPHAESPQVRDAVQAWLQRQAKALFAERCAHFSAELGVNMKSMRLSSAQTRWGSASADGSIRLNWRLIHYALPTIDYVVAHELAHLKEMNHSPRFWEVVRSVLPDFELARQQLREESLTAFAEI
ncbi:MAG TPA: SprT family zinc-dependent metalloprotease [Burkholderiaceae bacterium]